MKAAGEQAHLFYDAAQGVDVREGDYLRTGTGRLYLITTSRRQDGGKHAGRFHLDTTVMPGDHELEPDATVHTVHWYPRSHSRKARP